MINGKTITISQGGARLDAALLTVFPTSSKTFIKEALLNGTILVNGKFAAKGMKLRGGDAIEIKELLEQHDNHVQPDNSIHPKCIFEDNHLLAFDKCAGQPVQPLSCRETGTLMNSVVAMYPECQSLGDAPLMAGALHRIDADTSGLVLVARNQQSFYHLRKQFSAQTVEKTYLALVEGSVAVGGTLENDLIHDPTIPFCRMIDLHNNRLTATQRASIARKRIGQTGLHAITRFLPIAHTTVENEERTLLEVTIFTGVTHQIRAQLAIAGMHIINDRLYGAFAVENQIGHCLHALAAKFRHPASGDMTEIRTQYPSWAKFVSLNRRSQRIGT